MPRSISARIFELVMLGNLVGVLAILAFSWWALESLEATAILADQQIELDYFNSYGDKSTTRLVRTAQLVSFFRPNTSPDAELPVIFEGVPVPFAGEIESLGKDYSVITHAFSEGTLYLAKDLQLFEAQESRMIIAMSALAVIMLCLSLAMAWFASWRIAGPIVQLTTSIKRMPASLTGERLPVDFADLELRDVAESVNKFLRRAEESFARERLLASMASHELRTPVAVALGAARIIANRGQLGQSDAKTLQRIIEAMQEMSDDIEAALRLVRQPRDEQDGEYFRVAEILRLICDEKKKQNASVGKRLQLIVTRSQHDVKGDRALAKMALNNLISNALNHTRGLVTITAFEDHISVADEGGAAEAARPDRDEIQQSGSGLGLYIVRLACERLDWTFDHVALSSGTLVNIWF